MTDRLAADVRPRVPMLKTFLEGIYEKNSWAPVSG
jgi:hypothetical protein